MLLIVASLTSGLTDVALPTTRDVNLGGETYAWHEPLFTQMAGRYQIPTRRNLQNGGNAKAAEYSRGRWALDLMRRTIDDSFRNVDVVVLPTRRHRRRRARAEETDKPRNPELENTGQFNVYGIPAISVPCGFNDAGLPVGLMIAGPRFAEGRVLALARAFEQATDWHTRRPPLTPDTPVPAIKRTEGE
jgi:aspartyl-tRNA(Asn)/glutamyl-tRNA(Gln) amidotransferase subunit A